MLEAYSKGKTTNALKSLMELAPKKATIFRNGEEVLLPVEQVQIGDIFVVRPGESVPVDGVILEGDSAINESTLTGESVPVDKAEGDSVSAGTLNQSGFLKCRATRVGNDTTLSQIIQMVSDAAATKAPIAKVADKVSGCVCTCSDYHCSSDHYAWLLVELILVLRCARYFPYWLSAVRVHWVLLHRLPSWFGKWCRCEKAVYCSRQQYRWKKLEK